MSERVKMCFMRVCVSFFLPHTGCFMCMIWGNGLESGHLDEWDRFEDMTGSFRMHSRLCGEAVATSYPAFLFPLCCVTLEGILAWAVVNQKQGRVCFPSHDQVVSGSKKTQILSHGLSAH